MNTGIKITTLLLLLQLTLNAQNLIPFTCSGSDGFGYYISSATETNTATTLSYSNSRLSKIVTSSGNRTTVCSDLGRSMNALAFNPQDNYLYAVSRYDANLPTGKSGTLYRIGSNCVTAILSVSGPIVKFDTNVKSMIDNAGGNIGSGTFDLDNNYYVNTSYTNSGTSGFTNKIQKIRISSSGATVLSSSTLTCASCTGEIQINDIIFDEASNSLIGSNFINKRLYKINASTGVMTPFAAATTGLSSAVLGLFKNRTGEIRAITAAGQIYNVNPINGLFTLIVTSNQLISQNADAGSGCYAPPSISGNLFYDTNRLSDLTVNGTGTDKAGTTKMYANLVQNGVIVKSSEILGDGSYQFLGLFTGTYEVQISSIRGTIGAVPPSQNLPVEYEWVGDNIGTFVGNDGTPNGKLTVAVSSGVDVTEVNFGIDLAPVTVPVDFVSFEGSIKSNTVLLVWKTANEINNDYFLIEKEGENGEFESIGKVASSISNSYQFIDRNFTKTSTYRLKQIDFNGQYLYSRKISLHKDRKVEISVYPTFVDNDFKVLISNENQDQLMHLMIYTSTGKLICREVVYSGENEVDGSNFPMGILMYQVTDKNGNLLSQDRLVKN